ncbi:hypothetical protein ABIA52_000060 [Paenarthrobacter histidinolovorans]|uniref:Uncharacterized protein n=1 Tax=Paenarthrobacter histidinolovorans TaxID=43664 RepID=A0ABW8MZJ2_9MICC
MIYPLVTDLAAGGVPGGDLQKNFLDRQRWLTGRRCGWRSRTDLPPLATATTAGKKGTPIEYEAINRTALTAS